MGSQLGFMGQIESMVGPLGLELEIRSDILLKG